MKKTSVSEKSWLTFSAYILHRAIYNVSGLEKFVGWELISVRIPISLKLLQVQKTTKKAHSYDYVFKTVACYILLVCHVLKTILFIRRHLQTATAKLMDIWWSLIHYSPTHQTFTVCPSARHCSRCWRWAHGHGGTTKGTFCSHGA